MVKIIKGFMEWKKVAEKDSISDGKGREFQVEGKKIAVFHQKGQYHGIDAICVHQDGHIAPGKLEGDVVECPLHLWHYNIKTGKLLDYLKDVTLQTYKVEARNDGIYIQV